ncbi:MAG: flagellar hook-length control protein FliK [Deltaproteobacteria bacterium]|nr:flagellar hook-length control protein FliK [Deltaproteobacteria bacterium]
MNNLLRLELSPSSLGKKIPGKNRTPGDVGNSLFKDLLNKINRSSGDKLWGLSLYQGKGTTKHWIPGKDSVPGVSLLKKLDKKIRLLGVPSAQLMLPGEALPQLIKLLESQGLDKKQIDQLILSATDKDGLLQLDKIFARLFQADGAKAVNKNNLVIQSRHIPQIEEILFRMGLGVEDVKRIIEKSVNRNGDMALDRLSALLGNRFSGSKSEKELASLLEHFDIKSRPRAIDKGPIDPDLKKEFMHLTQTASQDIQKKIKQDIATLLRGKGIPPQEVKSFLETLSVDYTRSILKKAAAPTTESTDLLNQVFIKSRPDWHKGGWQEKIFEILRGERLLITKDSNKNWFQEQGDIRLNPAELLKNGDQKVKTDLFQQISGNKFWSSLENIENRTRNSSARFDPQTKDGLGTGFTMQKADKDLLQVGSVNQAKSPYNLPQPLPKILDRMIWMMRAGEQRGRIMIHPPELGRLDLNLAIKQGHLQVHLSAESIMVKEIIEANLNQLKQQLSDQGLVVDKFEVMVGLDNRRFKEGELWAENGRKKSSSSNRSVKASEDPAMREEFAGKSVNGLYQIDILV